MEAESSVSLFSRSSLLRILLTLAAASVGPVYAGTLTGVVVDDAGTPVPFANVRYYDRAADVSGETVANSAGRFQFEGVPDLAYHSAGESEGVFKSGYLRVEAEAGLGFRKAVGWGVAGQTMRLDLQRSGFIASGTPHVAAVVDAASYRPLHFPESGVTAGGLVVGFGENLGGDAILSASQIPLPETLGGFSIKISSQNVDYPAYPIYIYKSQFAAVLSGDVPPGPATVQVTYQGKQSTPTGVIVDAARLSFFTVSQTGQGQGVFTFPDFTPVTLQHSAKPGDVVIPWFTGGGKTPFSANQGGVFDFRSKDRQFDFFLGLEKIPDSDVLYVGTSGFSGVGQAAIRVPANTPPGCGAVFSVINRVSGVTPPVTISNPVTIPISLDGGPCGDPHPNALPKPLITGMSGGKVDRALVVTEWNTSYNGSAKQDATLFSFQGNTLTNQNYSPPSAANTCSYQWTLPGSEPLAPAWKLDAGRATLQVPGAFFESTPASNAGSFAARYGWSQALFDRMGDGPATFTAETIKLTFPGQIVTVNEAVTFDYTHAPWRYNQQMNLKLGSRYGDGSGSFPLESVLQVQRDAVTGFPLARETALGVFGGERGSHLFSCNFFPTLAPVNGEPGADAVIRFLERFRHLAPARTPATVRTTGFAWDPAADGRTVIRGGSGVYYESLFRATQQFNLPLGSLQALPASQ